VVLGKVPSKYGGGVGGGDVSKLFADKFHRDMSENFSAKGARDGFRFAAEAQTGEVYGVFAKEVVTHAHVGEAAPSEWISGEGWFCLRGSHLAPPGFCFCLSARKAAAWHMPDAEVANAGVANCKGL
jgi:hypothetical protein